MPQIKLLDALTVSKIAAGEVIDRPSSVVKELVENCIDSGATSIEIVLRDAGRTLIMVRDNGGGIERDDLLIAPLPHTTSKLSSVDELMTVSSYGFRGEALASMAHVASLHLTSAVEGGMGYHVIAHHNVVSDPVPVAHSRGTTVEVKDLFFNIPVRKKFLKSDSVEIGYVYDLVLQLALIHPEIDFKLVSQGNELLNTSGVSDMETLIMLLFSKEARGKLLTVDTHVGAVHVIGVIGAPTFTLPSRAKQVLAVNGRIIKNPVLQKCIMDVYRDLIPAKRYPLAVIDLRVDHASVDVNIHPQKMDVRFVQSGMMYDAMAKALRAVIGQVNYQPYSPSTYLSSEGYSPSFAYPSFTHSTPSLSESSSAMGLYDMSELRTLESQHIEFFQFLETYIILKASHLIYILDQHAVHERILYEQFKAQASVQIATQPLLISEVIALSPPLMSVFLESQGDLQRLGVDVEVFGEDQVVIRAIPTLMEGTSLSDWLLTYLASIGESETSEYSIVADQKERLQMKACKAAIKAGKRMPDLEVKQLLQDLVKSPSNFTCPHGRPLFITFGKSELERLFLR